jgi:hypothetical protein
VQPRFEDPDSGNLAVLGIFTTLRATKFPTPYRVLSIYALLTGSPGETAELEFQCVSADGEVLARETSRIVLGSLGKRHLNIRLDQLRFPEPGEYRFALSSEDEIIGEETFLVLEK